MDREKQASVLPEPFSPESYPKSYASIKQGDFRLKEFIDQDPSILRELSNRLYLFCAEQADNTQPVTSFKDLSYIGSGWEWSAFKKNPKTVAKIPAGIFPEVNDPLYLQNTQLAYETIKGYFPEEFVASTIFHREATLNLIEQELIEDEGLHTIPFSLSNDKLISNLKTLLKGSLRILGELQWMPDFWFGKNETGFELNNIVIQKDTSIPKIIDFTFYFDPYRIHPEKTKAAVAEHTAKIEEFLTFLKTK